jgi:L-arabinokinase
MLPADCEILLRTAVPREFFSKEISRPFDYEEAAFDCGCVQQDTNTIDVPKTLASYRELADGNRGLLDDEVAWCEGKRADIIVSDIVPFAFDVARRAGLPSVAATNFTWHTIYEEYTGQHPDFAPYLDAMRDQYAAADLLLGLYPVNEMRYFRKQVPVGPVGRVGRNVRHLVCSEYGISPDKRLGLIYAGNFGMGALPWQKLESFDGWEFIGLYPLPGSPANYHQISKEVFRYQDCIASADVMISKLGYGVCAECFINSLPIIYLPRTGFAEFPVLRRAVEEWGNGYSLSMDDFVGLQWHDALKSVAVCGKPRPMPSDGARACAREIERLA